MTLEFIISFIGMIVIGSMAMVGWYSITRGRIDFRPDGVPFKTGKLFKAWHFYFTQGKKNSKRLNGRPMVEAYIKLRDQYPFISINYTLCRLEFEESKYVQLVSDKEIIQALTGCSVVFDDSQKIMWLKKEFVEYRFPEYVRDPISECPTCFASIYGSILYWSFVVPSMDLFSWTNSGITVVLFWIFYCMSCAFLNTVLAKKL